MARRLKWTFASVALLAGAIVNVLVAWSSAEPSSADWVLVAREPITAREIPAEVAEYFGHSRMARGTDQGEPTAATLATYRSFACTRRVFRRLADGPVSDLPDRRHIDDQYGLPFRSLQYSVRDADDDILGYPTGPWRVEGPRGGWPLDRTPTWLPPRIYPLTILPFGFIANTLLYAGIVYPLLLVPGRVRRALRRRRGLCRTCTYDRRGLTASAQCPECGTPAPA